MLFFVAQKIELRWIVLEEMGTDSIADTCTATCDNVCLASEVGNVLVRIEGVIAEHYNSNCDGLIAELCWLDVG